MKFVVVLFHPRAGSSWLMSLLAKAPGTFVRYEILDTETAIRDGLVEARDHHICTAREQQQVIERFARQAADSGATHAAFKLAPYQCLDFNALHAQLASMQAQLIFLNRRNTVRAAVSQLAALELIRRSGQTNVVDGVEPVTRLHLERRPFFSELYAIRREQGQLAAWRSLCADLPYLAIDYEDMVEFTDSHLAALSAGLDLPLAAGQAPSIRRNLSQTLASAVENHADLLDWVRGTDDEVLIGPDAERGFRTEPLLNRGRPASEIAGSRPPAQPAALPANPDGSAGLKAELASLRARLTAQAIEATAQRSALEEQLRDTEQHWAHALASATHQANREHAALAARLAHEQKLLAKHRAAQDRLWSELDSSRQHELQLLRWHDEVLRHQH